MHQCSFKLTGIIFATLMSAVASNARDLQQISVKPNRIESQPRSIKAGQAVSFTIATKVLRSTELKSFDQVVISASLELADGHESPENRLNLSRPEWSHTIWKKGWKDFSLPTSMNFQTHMAMLGLYQVKEVFLSQTKGTNQYGDFGLLKKPLRVQVANKAENVDREPPIFIGIDSRATRDPESNLRFLVQASDANGLCSQDAIRKGLAVNKSCSPRFSVKFGLVRPDGTVDRMIGENPEVSGQILREVSAGNYEFSVGGAHMRLFQPWSAIQKLEVIHLEFQDGAGNTTVAEPRNTRIQFDSLDE